MATLYDLLGVTRDATAEQIEKAYASFKARLLDGTFGLPAEETNSQLMLIQDAYKTLSNPILRKRYDQKLALTNTRIQENLTAHSYEASQGRFFGFKSMVVIGVIVVASVFLYNHNAKQREALRQAHEREIQLKAEQIAEDRLRQIAPAADGGSKTVSTEAADTRQLRMDQLQFERESAQREQLDLQRQRLEMQRQQQERQEAANRARQEQYERQQRAQSEKRLLQQMERDRYGKVITY